MRLCAMGLLAAAVAGGMVVASGDGSSSVLHPVARAPLVDLESELPALPQVLLVSAYHERHHPRATADGAAGLRLKQVALEVKPGDTLMRMLTKAGAQRSEAHAAITALTKVFSPRRLKPGQQIQMALAAGEGASAPDSAPLRLVSLKLRPSVERDVEVVRDEQAGFVARAIERPLLARERIRAGTIESSLFRAATRVEVPQPVLMEAIRTFSFDVDFQRDIQPGDSFEFFYESLADETGREVKTGALLYAEMVLSGKPARYYRFTPSSGVPDYFNEKGQSVRKTLMRTPIDGARLSSGFGKRRHPILGYTRMHKGTDFAAPTGTPIYAAGDGVIDQIGRKGAYGKYIRIRHNSTYGTAYAHLNGYARGLKRGSRVRQGQVIGYVGSTGRSTGPHLHYEVLVNGKQVNPARVKLPSGEKLKGDDLAAFQAWRQEIDQRRTRVDAPLIAEAPGTCRAAAAAATDC